MHSVNLARGPVLQNLSKKLLVLFLLALLLLLGLASPAYAQDPVEETPIVDWQELQTDRFTIVYGEGVSLAGRALPCNCGVAEAERYAAFVDEIYADLAAIFNIELETPVDLRLFPTEESYYQVNPLAERLTGVIAHATNTREEIAIALPRTTGLSEEELVNNVRHEMAHLFVSALSDGKLTAGFQEGIAQYVEKPTEASGYDPALLRLAQEEGRLLTWAELDRAEQVYGDPQVAYPQTLSIVSFLVDRYGLPQLMQFMQAAAQEPGYRSALETVYGKPAADLEQEWQDYLPEYLDGRWRINAIYAYDLSRVTTLVERGAYGDAITELEEIVGLLESTAQAETLAQAESLLARARQGKAAAALSDQARAALQANDYPLAIDKGNAAIAAYRQLLPPGQQGRIPELRTYVDRALQGLQALARLQAGARLLESLRLAEAETALYEATATLQRLDHPAAVQQGLALLDETTRRKQFLAYGLLAAGLATLFFSTLRRALNRLRPEPMELELL